MWLLIKILCSRNYFKTLQNLLLEKRPKDCLRVHLLIKGLTVTFDFQYRNSLTLTSSLHWKIIVSRAIHIFSIYKKQLEKKLSTLHNFKYSKYCLTSWTHVHMWPKTESLFVYSKTQNGMFNVGNQTFKAFTQSHSTTAAHIVIISYMKDFMMKAHIHTTPATTTITNITSTTNTIRKYLCIYLIYLPSKHIYSHYIAI